MAELRGVQILQNELEKSKEKLKEFNENIKRLTGHENPRGRRSFDSQDYDDSFSGRMGRGRGRLFGLAKRGLMEDNGPQVKRRVVGGAFSRLGPAPVQRRVREDSPEDEDQPKRLSVYSSVVATSREAKNRQDIMQEQTKDKEGMQRNRRMFGLLLGTLNKFKSDSKTMESKEEQRRRIDQKLEENAEKEKKKFKQETMQLMEERHLEETRISRLEQKMEVVQEHADREKEMKKLKNFLCTKTKPRIFWKPRQMNSVADNKLRDSIKIVDDMLQTSQDRLEKEIKDVMEREQKREERIKMRLREDGLFLDEKEKESDFRDKDLGGNEEKDEDADQEKLRMKSRLDNKTDEKSLRKMRVKRRVVLEEHSDGDDSTEEEGSGKGETEEELIKSLKRNEKEKESLKSKMKKTKDDDSEDDSESESDSNSDEDGNKKSKKWEGDREEGNEDNTDDHDEENSRVVLCKENSRDKSRSSKDHKRDGSERSERRSREEKHGHGLSQSKYGRRDIEKGMIKEEREERHEPKKNRPSDRTVLENEEVKIRSRNPMNLIGEEEDVEMESENNITI